MATTTTPTTGTDSQQFLESVLPGISKLTSTATSNIGNLLSGSASPSLARTTNAYWGAGAGTPAGGAGSTGDINSFIGQRGTDLYGQQAQANQQTGLQDLLSTMGSYTSPALTNQAQQFQNSQFGQNLAQQGSQFNQSQAQSGSQFNQSQQQQAAEFNQTNQLQQLQTMLSALGL
jgi:hypothetical protein